MLPRRRVRAVEHVEDVVVLEEFEEAAKLGCCRDHRGAV
jgi:hypothetical protein